MSETEILDQKLSASGWKKSIISNKPGLDARYTFKKDNLHVKLDLRLGREALWLWYVDGNNRDCLGFPLAGKLENILDVITSKQDSLTSYMTDYFSFQQSCDDVQIMCWEQFDDNYADFEEDTMADKIVSAQKAHEDLEKFGNANLDEIVFPGEKVAKLSDYVKIMKKMQTGDMNGALQPYGLDIMSWGQVATAWGMKMASDQMLTQKFSKMLMQ